MSFTNVQNNNKTHSSGTSDTFTSALAAGAAGDVVILHLLGKASPTLLTANVTGESNFTMLSQTSNSVYSATMGYLLLTSGGAKEVNVSWDASWTGKIVVQQFSADFPIVLDDSNSASGVSANSSVSITTTKSGALIVSGFEKSVAVNPTPGTGYTGYSPGSAWGNEFTEYILDAGVAGVKSVDFTFSSATWVQQALAFYEAVPADDYTSGLVGWWKLDEVSGSTTAVDSSGAGLDATLTNADANSVWVTGKIDGAVELDGTDDYLSVPYDAQLASSEFTISAWFNTNAPMSDGAIYQSVAGNGYTSGYRLVHVGGGSPSVQFAWGDGVSNDGILNSTTLGAGWHLLTGTFDGTVMSLYLDGTLHAEDLTATFGYSGGGNGAIGSSAGVATFSGKIDDVRRYNRALPDTAVEALYDYYLSLAPLAQSFSVMRRRRR